MRIVNELVDARTIANRLSELIDGVAWVGDPVEVIGADYVRMTIITYEPVLAVGHGRRRRRFSLIYPNDRHCNRATPLSTVPKLADERVGQSYVESSTLLGFPRSVILKAEKLIIEGFDELPGHEYKLTNRRLYADIYGEARIERIGERHPRLGLYASDNEKNWEPLNMGGQKK